MAACYVAGRGVEVDLERALFWFEQSAARGVAQAQYGAGMLYATGTGTEQDLEVGQFWLRLAAEQGHAEATEALFLAP